MDDGKGQKMFCETSHTKDSSSWLQLEEHNKNTEYEIFFEEIFLFIQSTRLFGKNLQSSFLVFGHYHYNENEW